MPSIRYSCSFACGNASVQNLTGTFDPTTILLFCSVPFWPYQSCMANIIITENSDTLNYLHQFPMSFLFLPELVGLSPSYAPTIGGTNLFINGAGFDNNGTYICRFSFIAALNSAVATATYINPGLLRCSSPSLSIVTRSRNAIFTLENQGIPLLGPLQVIIFSFTAAVWYTAVPLSYSSAGGGLITVQGARFSSPPFRLQFRGFSTDITTNCQISVPEILLCETPVWPYESGPANDVSFEISLLDFFGTVGKTSGQAIFVLYGVGEWNYFEIQYPLPWTSYRSICVGNHVIIYGQNFRNHSALFCVFNRTDGILIKVQASVKQNQQLACILTNVSIPEQTLKIILLDENDVKIPHNPLYPSDNRINLTTPCWSGEVNPSQGPATGGTVLLLTGSGFCSLGPGCKNAFLCQFQAEKNSSMVVYSQPSIRTSSTPRKSVFSGLWSSITKLPQAQPSQSQIVNDSQIICATPPWPYPAAKAQVLLIDIRTGLETGRPVGSANGVVAENSLHFPFYIFLSFISSVAPHTIPASGLARLTIYGTGFGSTNTTCYFRFKSRDVYFSAMNVSSNEVVCSAPAWPALAGDTSKSVASLTILQGYADSPVYRSNQFALTYIPQFLGLTSCFSFPPCNITTGYAGIDFRVTVRVNGLDSVAATSYSLRFSSRPGQILNANLYNGSVSTTVPFDSLVFIANVSKWPFQSTTTQVTLVADSIVVASLESISFEFQQLALQMPNKLFPVIDPVKCPLRICWPLVITVFGAGFVDNSASKIITLGNSLVANESSYLCELSGQLESTSIIASVVTVDNPSQIRCIADVLGPIYYFPQNYSVRLRFNGLDIMWIGSTGPEISMSSVLTGLVCGSVCGGKALGGDVITIVGYGFSSNLNYSCVFVSEDNFTFRSTPAFAVSYLQLSCTTPEWLSGEGFVNVRLTQNQGTSVREALVVPLAFHYDAVWWFENSLTIFAGSVATLIVKGVGFIQGEQYLASYSCTDTFGRAFTTNSSQLVTAVSNSNLNFSSPSNLGAEGKVTVQLFRCTVGGGCMLILPYRTSGHLDYFNFRGSIYNVNATMLGDATFYGSCTGTITCWSPASGNTYLELQATGLHFLGVTYTCNFSSGLRSISSVASVTDSGNLICSTLSWPYEPVPVQVSVSVWSGISGILEIPEPFLLLLTAVVQSVSPTNGRITGENITVSGLGFSGLTLSCRFTAVYDVDPLGYTNFFLQSQVRATPLSSSSAVCDTSGAWNGYPGMKTGLDLVYDDVYVILAKNMSIDSTEIYVQKKSDWSPWMAHLLVGTYAVVNNETLKLINITCQESIVPNYCALHVMRGMYDSSPAAHSVESVVRPLVPLEAGIYRLEYSFDPVVRSLNASNARVDGGALLGVSAIGLEPSYVSTIRTVRNASCNVSSQFTIYPSLSTTPGPQVWGIAFDISTKFDIELKIWNFLPSVVGNQKLWILHRRSSTCVGLICSSWGHGLVFSDWEYLVSEDGLEFDAPSLEPIPFFLNFSLGVGQRHGFMFIAQKGLQVGLSDAQSEYSKVAPPGQSNIKSCDLFVEDSTIELHPGQLILAQTSSTSEIPGVPFAFIKAVGDSINQFRYQGSIQYLRQTIVGQSYSCKFSSLVNLSIFVKSPMYLAFSVEPDPVPRASMNITCTVPAWPHGAAITRFSVSTSQENQIDTDVAGHPIFFKMSAVASRLVGPIEGNATGGSLLSVYGTGLGSPNFFCRFSSLQANSQFALSTAMAFSNTLSVCRTPYWPFVATKVSFEIGTFDSPSVFSAVQWLNLSSVYILFTFYEVWEGIYPNDGIAGGNYVVLLRGAGFDASSIYNCVFRDDLGHSLNVTKKPFNSSLIQVPIPAWGKKYAAGVVEVKLFKLFGNNVEKEVQGFDEFFTFHVFWAVKKFYVNQTIESLVVVIEGLGFNTSSNYFLNFWSATSNDFLFSSFAVPTSTSQIVSTLRDWKFDGLIGLSLLDRNRQPVCSSGSIICPDSQVLVSLNETCLLVQPSIASALGGQILTVRGAGFEYPNSMQNYTCNFKFINNPSTVLDTSCNVADISHMYCKVPTSMQAGNYLLRILHGENVVPFRNMSDGFLFRIVEVHIPKITLCFQG